MSMTVISPNASAPAEKRRIPAGNTATGWLKVIALLFMFIDHSGKVLFGDVEEMRVLGRIAFPLYLWCMVVGFQRTRSVPRYLLRILVVGLVSQPLYLFALDYEPHLSTLAMNVVEPLSSVFRGNGGSFLPALLQVLNRVFLAKPNIFLTLFLGLCALWGIREKKYLSHLWAPAAALCLAIVLNADYGWKGVAVLIMIYAVRDSRPGIAAVMIAFFLYWGTSYPVITSLFGLDLHTSHLPKALDWLGTLIKAVLRKETLALLGLPLILIRFPWDLKMPRWLGYALYPGHLAFLMILKIIFFGL